MGLPIWVFNKMAFTTSLIGEIQQYLKDHPETKLDRDDVMRVDELCIEAFNLYIALSFLKEKSEL